MTREHLIYVYLSRLPQGSEYTRRSYCNFRRIRPCIMSKLLPSGVSS